ncbi:MAG: flagellar motor protein MotD [Gammaproteobacteria bacterium]|nr:flagellar motor protein MotD [Gammaproteobacteria bacterium]
MARRKKKVEEPENHERWLVSYADFITLLFAFFVVMYAISSVNEGKYRVLSDTMVEAFSDQLKEAEQMPVPLLTDENQNGDFMLRGEESKQSELGEQPIEEQQEGFPEPKSSDEEPADNRLWVVASNLDSSLQGFVDKKLVKINLQGDKIEIQLSSKMLFGSGSARLSDDARKAFRDIAIIIKPLNNSIHVEGHTDNVPIKTMAYPSNWELSAARAASVVEYLARQGVAPERLAAIGYGEFRPISSNDSEDGRKKNRRVTLVLRADDAQGAYGALGVESALPDQGDVPWAESPGGF